MIVLYYYVDVMPDYSVADLIQDIFFVGYLTWVTKKKKKAIL